MGEGASGPGLSAVRSVFEASFYRLPYAVRRALFSIAFPQRLRRYRRLRTLPSEHGYSLKPFDDYECIFVHIPKAAGVSVARSLFGNLGAGHLRIAALQMAFSRDEFERYFKFTFVRNPWDRVCSAYHFLQRGGMTRGDRAWAAANLAGLDTFERFVHEWLTPGNLRRYVHFLPQTFFLCLPGSSRLLVDFVGYFENLEADFRAIAHKLSIDAARALRRDNQQPSGQRRHYTELYTDAMRDIVAEVYRRDIEMLGYTFDNASLPRQLAGRRPLA